MPCLEREEYIEQAYFFRVFRERIAENVPAQEILSSVHEEILATTRLPMAVEFLKGEVLLNGRLSEGMRRLSHYFTPFQAFVISRAEEDRSKFDQKIALEVLQNEAEYRSGTPTSPGLFIYQFESISRNRLGYDKGMTAMAGDPQYDPAWSEWILKTRLKLGEVEFNELLYFASEQWQIDRRRQLQQPDFQATQNLLFGAKEGRIAAANRGRDPLYMFAALQRQLGYPKVPRSVALHGAEKQIPEMLAKMMQMEKRLQLVESELKDRFDLSSYYVKPTELPPDV